MLDATAEGNTIRCRLATAGGRARAEIRLEPGAEVVVTLLPDGLPCRETVEFPPALVPPQADAEWILPLGEGVRVRADQVGAHGLLGEHTWSQRALIMPWFGLAQGEGGAMVLVATPDDFMLGLREATPAETKGTAPVVCATNQWLPQGERLGYPRRLRYCLFGRGGYVAMARRDPGAHAEELPGCLRMAREGRRQRHGGPPLPCGRQDGPADVLREWLVGHCQLLCRQGLVGPRRNGPSTARLRRATAGMTALPAATQAPACR